MTWGVGSCTVTPWDSYSTMPLPWQVHRYLSPGSWAENECPAESGGCFQRIVTLAAGGRSTVVFNAAVRSQSSDLPEVGDGVLVSEPLVVFGDPAAVGWESDASTTTSLWRGRVLVKSERLSSDSRSFFFSARLRHTGWYTLHTAATRMPPPAGVTQAALSSRITLSWHFRVASISPRSVQRQLPVALAIYSPAGLDLSNDASRPDENA